MTNLKNELEEPKMKKVQEIIIKTIEGKRELKIDENHETSLENFTISYDEFSDYVDLVSDLLSFSGMTLSQLLFSIAPEDFDFRKPEMNSYYSSLEKCDFTKEDFFYYLILENQIWKVLDENVLDKELVSDIHFFRLENDFDDFMTDNRKYVYKFNFDQTDVWKELEPRIEKGIGNMGYLEKVKNWNKNRRNKSMDLKEQTIRKDPYEEFKVSKEYQEIFGEVTPNPELVKKLIQFSGNQCAFPKCKNKMIDSDGYLKGEICCIEYNVKNYARFNSNITQEEMVDFDNLILLCDVHHFETEFHEEKFSSEKLKGWKSNFESKNNENIEVDNQIVSNFIKKFQSYSPIETLGIHNKPKNKWSKLQELISTFGITICSKCGTRTKMIPTYEGHAEGWDGYAICPKCGQKEKWRIGE